MRTLVLLLAIGLFQTSRAQVILPKLSLLADSGIREIRLIKHYQGYYLQDQLLSNKDSGLHYLEFRYTLYPSGKIASYSNYTKNGDTAVDYHFQYNELGETTMELRHSFYSNSKDSIALERTDDGGFLKRKWHNEKLTQLQRYDTDSFLVEDRAYRESDSFITTQSRTPGKYEQNYYFQGKVVRHVVKEWHMKENKLYQYSEFEATWDSKKGKMKTELDVKFNVRADSTLKLYGWYEDNVDYTKISYANWFRKLEIRPIQYEDMFRLDEFITHSPPAFEMITFSGEGHRIFYEIMYH